MDLADFVSVQGHAAGENAARFVQGQALVPMPPETTNAMAKGLPQPGGDHLRPLSQGVPGDPASHGRPRATAAPRGRLRPPGGHRPQAGPHHHPETARRHPVAGEKPAPGCPKTASCPAWQSSGAVPRRPGRCPGGRWSSPTPLVWGWTSSPRGRADPRSSGKDVNPCSATKCSSPAKPVRRDPCRGVTFRRAQPLALPFGIPFQGGGQRAIPQCRRPAARGFGEGAAAAMSRGNTSTSPPTGPSARAGGAFRRPADAGCPQPGHPPGLSPRRLPGGAGGSSTTSPPLPFGGSSTPNKMFWAAPWHGGRPLCDFGSANCFGDRFSLPGGVGYPYQPPPGKGALP